MRSLTGWMFDRPARAKLAEPNAAVTALSPASLPLRDDAPLNRQHWVFGKAQEESLRVVLNHVSEAILLLDASGVMQLVNPFGEQLLGENADELIGKAWVDFLEPPSAFEFAELFTQGHSHLLAQRVHEHSPKEAVLRRPDGSLVDVDVSLSIIPAERPLLVCLMRDLSNHKKEHDELRMLARTDYLTQVANRRAFDEVLQRQWHACQEQVWPLSVLMIDIDHFKQLNDQFGHLQGDKMAARYGGEEFAVLLPGCNEKQASELAEKIRFEVAALSFRDQDVVALRPMSVSIGVACSQSQQPRDASALVNLADVALYRAKISGRNRVEYCHSA